MLATCVLQSALQGALHSSAFQGAILLGGARCAHPRQYNVDHGPRSGLPLPKNDVTDPRIRGDLDPKPFTIDAKFHELQASLKSLRNEMQDKRTSSDYKMMSIEDQLSSRPDSRFIKLLQEQNEILRMDKDRYWTALQERGTLSKRLTDDFNNDGEKSENPRLQGQKSQRQRREQRSEEEDMEEDFPYCSFGDLMVVGLLGGSMSLLLHEIICWTLHRNSLREEDWER
ncbi:hypothetical protein BT63DRAFT_451651 [Microthyrium microscopicum]|uniref:Uncharacterized protein n=1 Tax=Microthyrium microscopicum TaxID=703497 RepID=A0A6A6UMU2_9PEZI|nr:hypothetical protein BT63DRAFT_451651 [Microthyrium microscopicum]